MTANRQRNATSTKRSDCSIVDFRNFCVRFHPFGEAFRKNDDGRARCWVWIGTIPGSMPTPISLMRCACRGTMSGVIAMKCSGGLPSQSLSTTWMTTCITMVSCMPGTAYGGWRPPSMEKRERKHSGGGLHRRVPRRCLECSTAVEDPASLRNTGLPRTSPRPEISRPNHPRTAP